MVIDIFATLPTAEKPSQRKTTLRRTFESTWELDPFIVPILGVVQTLPGQVNRSDMLGSTKKNKDSSV